MPLPIRSMRLPRRQPERAPSQSPTTMATASPSPISRMVGPAAPNTTSVTGWPRNLIEYPRSPVSVSPM